MKEVEGTFTVKQLIDLDIIDKPMDGNHGSYHPISQEYVDQGVPFVMASDLVNGKIDFSGCKKISKERAEQLQKGFSVDGDVLLTHKATIGRTAIVSGVGEGKYVMLTPQVTYYRIKNKNVLDNRYLKYYFDSLEFQNLFIQWAGGGSTRAYLGITAQQDLPIKFPNIQMQRKIVSVIDPINQKIELNNQANETLESLAKAIFKEWFIDFGPVKAKAEGRKPFGMNDETAALFPDSFEESELGLIPKGWKVSTLGVTCEMLMGQSPPGDTYNENKDGIIFYQGRAEFGERFPSPRLYCTEPSRIVESGTVLLSVRAPVGDINIATEKTCIGRGLAGLKHKAGGTSFTVYLLKSLEGQFDMYNGEGTVFGSINKETLGGIKHIEPPSQIMSSFLKNINPLDNLILSNFAEINQLIEIRDQLLPRLISGEINL